MNLSITFRSPSKSAAKSELADRLKAIGAPDKGRAAVIDQLAALARALIDGVVIAKDDPREIAVSLVGSIDSDAAGIRAVNVSTSVSTKRPLQ